MNRRILYLAAMIALAAIGRVQAQTDIAALQAKSAALGPADQAAAKQLFATGFTLWQSGDFAAAELAFKQGLDSDPANALANYYYGDCLARRKDKAEAADYLGRAVALGGNTPEAFKAKAELQQLSVAPASVADMGEDDVETALLGNWKIAEVDSRGSPNDNVGAIAITGITGGAITATAKYNDGYRQAFKEGHVGNGAIAISLTCSGCNLESWQLHFTSPSRLDGRWSTGGYSGVLWLVKQ